MVGVAQLKAMLGLDSSQYVAGAEKAKGATAGLAKNIQSVGSALGVAFSVSAITRMGAAFVQWAGEVSDAAKQAGILTADMIALEAAALGGGASAEDMRTAIVRVNDAVLDAAKGSKEARKTFADLGISFRDLFGMDPTDRLIAVAQAVEKAGLGAAGWAGIIDARAAGRMSAVLADLAKNGLEPVAASAGVAADSLDDLSDRFERWKQQRKGEFAVGALGFMDLIKGKNPALEAEYRQFMANKAQEEANRKQAEGLKTAEARADAEERATVAAKEREKAEKESEKAAKKEAEWFDAIRTGLQKEQRAQADANEKRIVGTLEKRRDISADFAKQAAEARGDRIAPGGYASVGGMMGNESRLRALTLADRQLKVAELMDQKLAKLLELEQGRAERPDSTY